MGGMERHFSKEKSLSVFLQSFSAWSFNYSAPCYLMLSVENPFTKEGKLQPLRWTAAIASACKALYTKEFPLHDFFLINMLSPPTPMLLYYCYSNHCLLEWLLWYVIARIDNGLWGNYIFWNNKSRSLHSPDKAVWVTRGLLKEFYILFEEIFTDYIFTQADQNAYVYTNALMAIFLQSHTYVSIMVITCAEKFPVQPHQHIPVEYLLS